MKIGTLKKKERKRIFFAFTLLHQKIYVLLENIFGKTLFILLHLHCSFFIWQVIENAVIKHQCPYRYALVL